MMRARRSCAGRVRALGHPPVVGGRHSSNAPAGKEPARCFDSVAMVVAPASAASTISGPAMSAAHIRAIQAQGVGEIIVEREAGVAAAEQATLRARAGASYVGPGPLPNTEIDRAPAGRLAAVVATLARDPQVRYAGPL